MLYTNTIHCKMATGGGYVRSLDKGCDEFYECCCSPCSAQDRNVEAINFCVECREYFCQKCLGDHNKFAMMKLHQILDKTSMKTQGQQATSVPTEKCTEHHGNLIDTYCGRHDEVCCGTCVSLTHRSCNGMAYLPTAAKGITNSREYKDIKSSMENIQHELDKMKKARQYELQTLETDKDHVLTQIKHFRKRVIKKLDKLEKTATDELLAKHQAFQDEINADINTLEEMLRSVEANMNKLETTSGNNESQLFVYVKSGKKTESDGRKLLQKMEKCLKRSSLNFSLKPDIEDFLNSQKSLGEFQNEMLYSASLYGEYNAKVKKDNNMCDINAVCGLEDGTILVVDSNNDKVKRLDRSYQVRDHCDLPGTPYAVCASGSQEVAVTLFRQQKVQFVDVGNTMKLTSSFVVEGVDFVRGLANSNDQMFVACRPHCLRVRVYTKSGTLLKTIKTYSAVQNVQSEPCHIAFSSDHTQIHIGTKSNGLITMGINGNKQLHFTDPELEYAHGVCVGNNDEVFVCGYYSHNIIQIGRGGRKVGVLLAKADGLKKPQSLYWDKVNSRLIVTMESTNHIKVFDIKKQY